MISDACSFAENFSRTYACACAAKGVGRQDVHGRALHVAVTNLADEAGNIYFCGACVDTWCVVTVVATARRCSRRGGVEQGRHIRKLTRQLLLRQPARCNV